MITEMETRKYTLRERARSQRETRERIVDAAMALHEEIGPAATSISGLAERAGVQRATVYRHFRDEGEILGACSAKFMALNPLPDMAGIEAGDPLERARGALQVLYRYFGRTARMWASVYRDLGTMEELAAPMADFERQLARIRDDLLANWPANDRRKLRATLDHALRFSTWQSLDGQKLSARKMADLVSTWLRAAADSD